MSFEVVYNTALKIYSKLYVGVKSREVQEGKAPLAFATPYEENAAGLKRQATVKSWVGTSVYDYKTRTSIPYEPDLRVVENKPRIGWKITDDVKRVYWGGGNVVWRLEDPLGPWEIEIQSSNLMAIIQACGISTGGVIEGECVLARDGAHNVLLPVSSQEYKDAIKAAEGVKAPGKIPMKDRVIGRTYRMLDGTYGTYLGKHFVSSQDYGNNDHYQEAVLGIEKNGARFSVESQISAQSFGQGSEQFEGVYVPEVVMYPGASYSYKKQVGQVKYYKSAPLIAELDQAEAISLDEAIDLANKSEMVWAGSKSGYPIMACAADHAKMMWKTRKIDDKKFMKLKTETIKEAKQNIDTYKQQVDFYEKGNTRTVPVAPMHNIGKMTSQYGDVAFLQVGDAFYHGAHAIDLANRGYGYGYGRHDQEPHDYVVIAGVHQFHSWGQQSISPKNYHPRATKYSNEVSHSGRTPTITYEQFATIEQLEAHIDELHSLGAFVEKFVTIKEQE